MPSETKVMDIYYRNSGEIKGSLSNLQPFLLLAKVGIRYAERRRRISEQTKGRFIISEAVNKGAAPKLGLILPVSRCRNPAMVLSLLNLEQYLVSTYQYYRAKETRNQAQRALNDVFGEDFRIHPRASLDGFIEFERTKGLFRVLAEHFDYVEALRDDPNGTVEPLIFQPFCWPSYGQFLEWFYEGVEPDLWGWSHCSTYLVFDKVCHLRSEEFGRDQIEKPSLDLGRYFKIAPNTTTHSPAVRLEMQQHGWIYLRVHLGESTVCVRLSDVFSPFEELLSWLKMLDRHDIPAQFHIDEEGVEKTLAVFSTDDMSRVLFRIVDRYTDEIFIEGIVDRIQLIEAFRLELRRFFKIEFDPTHWRGFDDGEEDGGGIKEFMLGDHWLIR